MEQKLKQFLKRLENLVNTYTKKRIDWEKVSSEMGYSSIRTLKNYLNKKSITTKIDKNTDNFIVKYKQRSKE